MTSNNSTCSCNVKNNLRSMIGYRYDSDHDFYEQLKKAIYYDGETYIGVCERLIELIGSGCCHGKVDVNADREAAADWVDDFRDEVAGMLGIACNGMADDVQDAIKAEIDKRLMPSDIEWPMFEDGEHVEFGSAVDGLDGPCEKFIFTRSMGGVCQLQDADGDMVNVIHGECVKSPEPEVLAADGLPIKVGETVYLTDDNVPFEVQAVRKGADKDEFGEWYDAGLLTHTRPDTQERIDDDAHKVSDPCTYFSSDGSCAKCRFVSQYGDADSAYEACPKSVELERMAILDLLCRQRELDARTMGGE